MHRFKFEALLNHRRHQEEVCQKELARAERRLADEKAKLRRLKNEKRDHVDRLQTQQTQKINVHDIILSVNYIQQLSENIGQQKNAAQKAARTVNQKRSELISIVKKRKTLERLKEKDRLAYKQKMIQDERKLMDEIASNRHARKR